MTSKRLILALLLGLTTLFLTACQGANQQPLIADAGADQTVAVGARVTLGGNGSSDGDSLSYAWEFEDKPAASAATLDDSASVTPSFVADVAGEYLVVLTVSDGEASATESVTVTATEAGQPVTEGVVLEDAPDTLVAEATYDFQVAVDASENLIGVEESSQTKVLRTELNILFTEDASVEDANALLERLSGRIVSMVRNVPAVIVKIPDPGDLTALEELIAELERDPVVLAVIRSVISDEPLLEEGRENTLRPQALPETDPNDARGIANDRIDHLLAVRAHAAWNLRDAILPLDERPWLVIGDVFGDGAPDDDYDLQLDEDDFATDTPLRHGYHVLGIATGVYGPSAGNKERDDVTGMFLATLNIRAVDVIEQVHNTRIRDALVQRLNEIVDDNPDARIVINTSLNDKKGRDSFTPEERTAAAAIYALQIRNNSLEDRVVHLTSAGNAVFNSFETRRWNARDNSLYAYAALGEMTLSSPGVSVRVPNLTNVLVIENRINTVQNQGTLQRPSPGCANNSSIMGGHLSAIGTQVWSFGRVTANDSRSASFASGTSMATPQVSGLAAYIWSLDTSLTSQNVMSVLTDTARDLPDTTTAGNGRCNAVAPQPVIDAFDAVLAAGGDEARTALLNISGGLSTFDEFDLTFFLNGLPGTPTLDYGRLDLNGDGVTDGALTSTNTDRLNLNNDGTFGTLTKNIGGQNVQFDEAALTDMDIMCYYAYDSLYTGSSWQRSNLLPSELIVNIAGDRSRYVPVMFDDSGNASIEDFELFGSAKGPVCTTPIAVDPAKLEWFDARGNLLETGPRHTVTTRDLALFPSSVPYTVALRYVAGAQTAEVRTTLIPCVAESNPFAPSTYPQCPFTVVEGVTIFLDELMDLVDMAGIIDALGVIKKLPGFEPCGPEFCDPPEFPYDQATLRESSYGDRTQPITDYLDRLFEVTNSPTFEKFETQFQNLQITVAAEEELSALDRELFITASSVVLESAEFFAPYEFGGRNGWRAFDFADDPNALVDHADILAPAKASLEGFLTAVVSTNTRSEFASELSFGAASYAAALEALHQARVLVEEGF